MKTFFWVLYGSLVALSLVLIWPRISQERLHGPIETVMAYSDIVRLSESEKLPIPVILARFKHAGLTSLSLTPASSNIQIQESFFIVLRVSNTDSKLPVLSKNDTLLFDGPEVYGYPFLLKDVGRALQQSGCRLGMVELYPQAGIETLAKALPSQIIRVHSIPELEIHLLTPDAAISRYMRAIRERRVNMLFLHPYMHRRLSSENLITLNTTYLTQLSLHIHQEGYALTKAEPLYLHAIFRMYFLQYSAWLLVLVIPILAILTGLAMKRWWAGFLVSVLITAGGAVMVSALLLDPVFLLGIIRFPFISGALVIPALFIGAFSYFRDRKFIDFLKQPLLISHLVCGLLCVGIIGVYVMRSGHSSVGSIPILEVHFRSFLEHIFSVRPRTKEFLFGYPALMLAFMFPQSRYSWLYAAMGSIALVSLLNSFCHLHTPLWVSTYRSVLGLGLGLIVGAFYLWIRRLFR
ncbi:MAG: hypothetical protein EXS67_01560 [Candidatus Margulisbacteria bacterium]|nr:hypothetical protein [Candidatus Margulisiibacteriota bacterium]